AVALPREWAREAVPLGGGDREAGRGAVPAPAQQVIRARRERAVEIERADRAARSLPRLLLPAGDQHDRPVVALDETGRDDSDHALVPVGVGERVPVTPPPRLGPLLDLLRRRPENAILYRLPLPVHLLEALRQPLRLGEVVGQEELERFARMAEPAGGVDPRCEPEADRALVDDRGIDVRDLHQRAQSRLLRASERAQPRACERAVLVDERD